MRSNTWILNKITGKWENRDLVYRKKKTYVLPKKQKKSHKKKKPAKLDKKTATAYYGLKQNDIHFLKIIRRND